MKKNLIRLLLFVNLCSSYLAVAQVLLPQPQKIQYGKGRLSILSLSIRIPSGAAAEDWFAARELSRILSNYTGQEIPIAEGEAKGKTILLNRTGPLNPLPVPGEATGADSREAYTLKITSSGGEIRSGSSAGIYYGVQTVRQLLKGEAGTASLPEVEIEDWPSLAYRGTMVDMSHGPLLTEAEIKRQLELLARYKGNQYYFYTEASIELNGFRILNPQGRFTQEQVRRIIDFAREHHIDVVPCLELYGHLHDLFRMERFSDLAVFPHAGEFDPTNPKVNELLANWIEQFAKLFPSPFVHIGFDETWQISNLAKKGAGLTPAKLFVKQLKDVAGHFQQHGKQVMAWADVMVHYPEIMADMPPGIIAIAWTYDAEKSYEPFLGPLDRHNIPYVIAPGVRSWGEIVPDFDLTFANIDAFLKAGRQAKALGVINTVWSDEAQLLMRQSWPGMAYGAVAAWQPVAPDSAQFLNAYAASAYPASVAAEVAQAMQKLNRAENYLQKVLGQETMSALWQDPLDSAVLKDLGQHRENLRQTRLLAEEAFDHLDKALSLGGDPLTLNALLVGSRLLDYAGMKFLYALEIPERWAKLGSRPDSDQWWNEFEAEVIEQNHGRIIDLMEFISELKEDYRAAWLSEYAPYRLESALGRWDGEYQYWRSLQERFRAFSRHRNEKEDLPKLETIIRGQ
jgi:hexosaminidase